MIDNNEENNLNDDNNINNEEDFDDDFLMKKWIKCLIQIKKIFLNLEKI